jgi:transposase
MHAPRGAAFDRSIRVLHVGDPYDEEALGDATQCTWAGRGQRGANVRRARESVSERRLHQGYRSAEAAFPSDPSFNPLKQGWARTKSDRGQDREKTNHGILWVLRTGAPWADLPDRYPSYQTCHRPFQQWVRWGALKDILSVVAEALHDEGYLNVQEAFIDGSFALAKNGGNCVGKTKRGKGTKIMAIADRHDLLVAVHVESATPHEVTLVKATLAQTLVRKRPERLVGDAAYESDQLDAELAQRGVELIAPHRRDRKRKTQDSRPLRRYRRRWKVERLFAWLQNAGDQGKTSHYLLMDHRAFHGQ